MDHRRFGLSPAGASTSYPYQRGERQLEAQRPNSGCMRDAGHPFQSTPPNCLNAQRVRKGAECGALGARCSTEMPVVFERYLT